MPSTIGWLAVAIAVGALAGLAIGHWSMVTAWLHHCLEDPVEPPPAPVRDKPAVKRFGRT